MSVNVGSAVGYLDLDISGFLNGLKSAQSEASSTAQSFQTVGEGFESVGKKIAGVGLGMTATFTTPVVAGLTTAVKSFAGFEQAVGGVETLFKNSANAVIANSETAYIRAGVSGTAYMEQVTSFSARLLQGLGGNTVEAARLADMAMVDMSDNANKFGTDVASIQNAYQGFAKNNFTMLDNLKLGFGGTAEEMNRLLAHASELSGQEFDISNFNDIIEAIHIVQKELGIAGTTSIEATETIAGSFGMAKASIADFLAQLGNPGADMEKFKQNMVDAVTVFVDNIREVLGTIWENLPIAGWQKNLIVATAVAGPFLLVVGKLIAGIGGLIVGLSKIPAALAEFSTAWGVIQGAMSKAMATLLAAAGPIVAVVAVVGTLVAAFVHLWNTNDEFRENILATWQRIKDTIDSFVGGIVERINSFGFEFEGIVEVLKTVWDGFTKLLAPVFEAAFTQIANVLEFALDTILNVLDIFIGIVTGDWDKVWTAIGNIFSDAWKFIEETFANWSRAFFGVFEIALNFIGTTWEEVWTSVRDFFVNIGRNIAQSVTEFVNNVILFFEDLPYNLGRLLGVGLGHVLAFGIDVIESAINTGQNFIANIVKFFTELPGKVKGFLTDTYTNVTTWVPTTVGKAKEAGQGILDNIVTFVKQLPETVARWLADTFKSIVEWGRSLPETMKEIGRNMVQGVIDGITSMVGNAISNVTGFFTGIVDGVKSVMEIASPSRVFAEIGRFMAEGVGVGFDDASSSVKGAVNAQMSDVGSQAASSIGQSLVGGMAGVQSAIAEAAGLLPQYIQYGIQDNVLYVNDAMAELVKQGRESIEAHRLDFQSAGADIATNIGQGVATVNNAGALVRPTQSLVDAVYEVVKSNQTALVNSGADIPHFITTGLYSGAPWANKAMQQLVEDGRAGLAAYNTQMEEEGRALALSIATGIVNDQMEVSTAADGLAIAVTSSMASGHGQFTTSGANVVTAVTSGIKSGTNKMTDAVATISTAGQSVLASAVPDYQADGQKLTMATATGIIKSKNQVVGSFNGVLTEVEAEASSHQSAFDQIGVDLIQGIINGFKRMERSLVGAASSLVGKVINVMRSLMMIASPSKVTTEMGVYLAQGLGVGMENGTDLAVDSAENMVYNILDAFGDASGGAGIALDNMFDGLSVPDGAYQLGEDIVVTILSGMQTAWKVLESWTNGNLSEVLQNTLLAQAVVGATTQNSQRRPGDSPGYNDNYGGRTDSRDRITQHIVVNSGVPLSPTQVAREVKLASQDLTFGPD